MVSDALYDLSLSVLEDKTLEEEEKTEKLEELVQKEVSLSGQPLEDAVLSILWRFRDSKAPSVASPPVRHTIIRRNSPAPWQIPRSSTPASPALSRASPVPPPGFGAVPSAFMRSKSYGGSPFGSPRPSPRLAFASPIPHSPSLSSYEFSEPNVERNEYGDYGSDTVDWLVNEDSASRPSSSGAGSASESGLNAAAASWIQPQQNEMSPYDMLRSVMGDGKSDEEIEGALEASGYDLSTTLMNLMGTKGGHQQEQSYFAENDGQVLIGKSMMPSEPITIDQTERGRSNIVCKYWLSNGSCLRADCRFSHDLSSHICKYWVMGNCLAGDSCIFSHDPALLMKSMNLGDATIGTPPPQLHPSFQVQDYDTFPALQPTAMNQWAQSSSPSQTNSYNYSGSQSSNSHMSTPRRHFEARTSSMNGMSSSYGSSNSRPTSRHRSRDPTPSPAIPAVDDTEAFPSLGAAGIKVVKKHHGKRGGHGHGHSNKENTPNSLADVVRMSPSPAPGLLRKGLMKTKSYTGSLENTLAANAIPAPQHVPWLETGAKANQEYLKARQDAFKHGGLRNKFLQSAAQAWNRNDARAAKALSLRGQSENDLMRKAHREAARLLYEERNRDSSSSQEVYVDLHGLHPEEAVEYLEHALDQHQNSSRPVYAITGTGHHSKNGKDKVGKAIRSWLSEWKYAYREFSVAGDNLGGILGVDPRSFDKSMIDEKKGATEGAMTDEGTEGKIKFVKEVPTGPKKAGHEDPIEFADNMTSNPASSDMQAKTAYRPSADAFDSIVQIKVGPQKQLFNMHKKLLCDTSGFFGAALNGNFKESKNQVIEMAEDSADVFSYFQYWAYTGVIEQKPSDPSDISWHTLAGIYIFAEARCIPALQNMAIDILISKHESLLRAPIEEYRYIYENTAEQSPVRRFLAEWAAHKGNLSKHWFHDKTIYPTDFAIDLSLALYDRVQNKTSHDSGDFWRARSKYHTEVAVASSSGRKSGQC